MENITVTTLQVRVLEPEQGKYLTQTAIENEAERTFSKKVYLAQEAAESDWRIANQAEKDEYQAQMEARLAGIAH